MTVLAPKEIFRSSVDLSIQNGQALKQYVLLFSRDTLFLSQVDEANQSQPVFHGGYIATHTPYSTEPVAPPATLTPISLPDTSFRPSPAFSHHPQEYPLPENHYNYRNSIVPQGLGISAPFPSNYPQAAASSSGYVYLPGESRFKSGPTPGSSPQAPPSKCSRRTSSRIPTRKPPVTILPHPEGLFRLECERLSRHIPPCMHPRAPDRGRRDPQADEEDAFVENLREQNLAWRVVRERFRERFNKDASEPRLQMRLLRRRKERSTRWDDADVSV